MKQIIVLSALILVITSSTSKTWQEIENGVVINLAGGRKDLPNLLRLQFTNKNIIHISATPGDSFSEEKSLCVLDNPIHKIPFKLNERKGKLILSTADMKVEVMLSSGQVTFVDNEGKIILREVPGGGKSFSPITVEGTGGYSIGQIFESPDDEAFYGLGQHQSDEFNYKGLNESLYQYNTKVSIPFIVSNRNYGILLDNYSLTKFGDPRDYSQLDLFKLYDDKGIEGGITNIWYDQGDTTRILLRRRTPTIDYENLTTIKNFPNGAAPGRSFVTWTGYLEPVENGLFNFKLYYAGYIKLWLGNELVVPERWRTAWNPNTYKFARQLEKGKKYPVRIEWNPDGVISYIGLKVLSPRDQTVQGQLSLFSEMGDQLDYYFIKGNNPDEVISGYRTLTGKAPVMPKWAMGFWQSRERYRSQDELINVVKEYRKRGIPLDNIVLDWSYWPVDAWGSHEFDPKFFPDPEGMVNNVHNLHARIMISVWPKFYITTEHYKEFDEKGWMYKQAVKDSIRDWIGKGYIGSFYDPYSEGARELFWNQIREHLYTKGFDAWWMDASEPDILSNASIEYRKMLSTPTALGPSAKYFNTYALMNAEAIYNGQRSVNNNNRVFLLTRSGFAGLQRYSTATWSGDIATRWEDMKAQIPAGLNFSLAGIPYWTMDIGGFCVENRYARAKEGSEDMNEWRELYTRWYQFGSFCPLFRSHGQFPYREVYNISSEGQPAYNSMVYYDKLRYSLMPYIYSMAGMTWLNDYTIMRAMVMDFESDKKVNGIGDQYMFGPSIMVAPVYRYKAVTRSVYFPETCGWYDFYTGKNITGGQRLEIDAPFERIPLFVKEGSIIAVGPDIQYSDEHPADPLTLWIYSGKNSSFTLYEDEGTNYNYEKGIYSTIEFKYNDNNRSLIIGKRRGEYPGMLKSRTINLIYVTSGNPVGYNPVAIPQKSIAYDGDEVIVTLN